MIDLLQAELLPSVPETGESSPTTGAVGDTAHDEVLPGGSGARQESGPTGPVDLFIKTYPEDYRWLYNCLKSISKFATGFRQTVIVASEPLPEYLLPETMPGEGVKTIVAGEQPDGYLWQQVIKLSADKFTDAGHICFIDCDTLFTRPVRPEDYFAGGKPIWMMTPYTKIDVPWKPIIEKFMGRAVEYEFMRRFPVMVPRWLLKKTRDFCKAGHGVPLDLYVLAQPKSAFSEFNALGAFAYEMHRDKFHWVSTDSPESEWPTLTVAQHWSKGGLTPEIKASIDKILGGGLAEKIIPYTPTLGPPPNLSSCEAGKISDKGGGPPPNGIRQTQAGWWVLEGDNFISKWVEDEGRLDHDQWLLERIRPLAGAGDTVIEVGAYIGDHTQWFLNRGCRVIAYEPNPQACECLRRNCPGAEVHEVALWHEPAQLEFENGGVKENPGASWVVEHFAGRPIKAIPLDFEPVERVDLMMIDAEGSELFVLQGALKTIRKHRPSLIIELNSGAMKRYGYSQEAIFDFLRGEGYTWHPIQPLMVADPPQYDIIARPTRAERADIKPEADRVLADGLANAVERLRVHAETGTNERKQVMFRLARAGLTPRYPHQKRKKKAKYNAKKKQQQESLYETQGTL